MAVATGKSRRGLDREMTLLGAACWFASSRTADCTKSKPDPQMLLELMSESGACPESTVMIGDSVLDLQMAAAAGGDELPRPRFSDPLALPFSSALSPRHGGVGSHGDCRHESCDWC